MLAMLSATLPAVALPTAAGAGSARADEQLDPGIVIKVDPELEIHKLAALYDLRVAESMLGSRGLYRLEPLGEGKAASEKAMRNTAKRLARIDRVVYAESSLRSLDFEDDSRFHAWPQGYWEDLGQDAEVWLNQQNLRYLSLHSVHHKTTGAGVTVALLDTGVDLDHRHLVDHLGAGGYDYIDDDDVAADTGNGLDDDGDDMVDEAYGHGTHTAGLIALVAPEADIVVYRVLNADGRGSIHVVAEAIYDAVDSGADVINMSFGLGGKHDHGSKIIDEALKYATQNGVIVIAAAGNRSSKDRHFPSGEKDVMGVAATQDGNHELAFFSNHGGGAYVAAPGENIVSTVPGDGFGAWSGTSMATAIVSAEAALIISLDPEAKPQDVIKTIGSDNIKLRGRNKVERGLIDVRRSVDKADRDR